MTRIQTPFERPKEFRNWVSKYGVTVSEFRIISQCSFCTQFYTNCKHGYCDFKITSWFFVGSLKIHKQLLDP